MNKTDVKFNITVQSNIVALFVWLETPKLNGTFSDNGFLLYSRMKNITYEIDYPITALELNNDLKKTSLFSEEHLEKPFI